MVGIAIAVLSTLVVAEGVGLVLVTRRGQRVEAEMDARVAEADSDAMQAASRAGAEGAAAALAPALAELDAQLAVLDAQPAYCAPGDLFDRRACLLDRCMAHAAVETDGASRDCADLANLVISAEGLAIIEGSPPGEEEGAPSAEDVARRQGWLRARK